MKGSICTFMQESNCAAQCEEMESCCVWGCGLKHYHCGVYLLLCNLSINKMRYFLTNNNLTWSKRWPLKVSFFTLLLLCFLLLFSSISFSITSSFLLYFNREYNSLFFFIYFSCRGSGWQCTTLFCSNSWHCWLIITSLFSKVACMVAEGNSQYPSVWSPV